MLEVGYDLKRLLRESEDCLCISATDYKGSIEVLVDNVRERLSRQYQVEINDVEELAKSGSINLFVDSLSYIHSKVSGYFQVCRCNTSIDINLDDINYLGFSRQSMLELLCALQLRKTQPEAKEAVLAIKEKLSKTTLNNEKRLFVLLIVCYELNIPEMTSAIAELLYFGGAVA